MNSRTADHFYIFLLSNAQDNNHIGNFSVRLARAIKLDGPYEVALTNIIFPLTYDNVTEGVQDGQIDQNGIVVEMQEGDAVRLEQVSIPPANYDSTATLVQKINECFKLQFNERFPDIAPMFHYDSITRRCKVTFRHRFGKILLSQNIAYLLGLPTLLRENVLNAPYPSHTANEFMFIYCDILDLQMVSNVMAPLLRIVTMKGQPGENCELEFDHPQYVPVLKSYFDNIKIELKNDLDRIIKFHSGKVAMTLHFRPRC